MTTNDRSTDNQRDEAERQACCTRVNQALGRYSHWPDDSNITLRIGDLREFARQSPQAESSGGSVAEIPVSALAKQLMKFYGMETYEGVIYMQDRQIEGLQERLKKLEPPIYHGVPRQG